MPQIKAAEPDTYCHTCGGFAVVGYLLENNEVIWMCRAHFEQRLREPHTIPAEFWQ